MQLPVGEYIRQLRRQRSLTQTELGGEHFSKSYVSAVERDKIVPSHDALRFFAKQLDQPVETFEQLVQEAEEIKQTSLAMDTYAASNDADDQEVVALLDIVLRGKEFLGSSLPHIIEDFHFEANIHPSLQKKARYAFLRGLQAQIDKDLVTAQSCFEYALPLAPAEYRPAILDALGTNSYLTQAYESALDYHRRSLKLLEESAAQDHDLLYVELHCANDYRSLQAHHEAGLHYERARRYLRATNNMQIAGELYLGLGYCMYASLFQSKNNVLPVAQSRPSAEEIDRSFELSLNFLLQSRTLYQVSGDQKGEYAARLMQAMVLLDFCAWRQYIAQEKARADVHNPLLINCASLLDDAAEQCRQVLLGYQATPLTNTFTLDQRINVYTALAYLIRISTQRATLARLDKYHDTARKELSFAIHTCQQTLDSLQDQALFWKVMNETLNFSSASPSYHSTALPRIPDPSISLHCDPTFSAEVYFASGIATEELGMASSTPAYAQECYDHSDQFFRLALTTAHRVAPDIRRDTSYLIRFYQRYIDVLKQRATFSSCNHHGSQKLLDFFNEALSSLQQFPLPYSRNVPMAE